MTNLLDPAMLYYQQCPKRAPTSLCSIRGYFVPQEAGVLQKAAREELVCPRCEVWPLRGEEIVSEIYHGVRLTCPDIRCGFVEY